MSCHFALDLHTLGDVQVARVRRWIGGAIVGRVVTVCVWWRRSHRPGENLHEDNHNKRESCGLKGFGFVVMVSFASFGFGLSTAKLVRQALAGKAVFTVFCVWIVS